MNENHLMCKDQDNLSSFSILPTLELIHTHTHLCIAELRTRIYIVSYAALIDCAYRLITDVLIVHEPCLDSPIISFKRPQETDLCVLKGSISFKKIPKIKGDHKILPYLLQLTDSLQDATWQHHRRTVCARASSSHIVRVRPAQLTPAPSRRWRLHLPFRISTCGHTNSAQLDLSTEPVDAHISQIFSNFPAKLPSSCRYLIFDTSGTCLIYSHVQK